MDINKVLNREDVYGKYAWSIMKKTILYASSLVPDVTENFNDIDDAMKCGFNWSKGPFEILNEIDNHVVYDEIISFLIDE